MSNFRDPNAVRMVDLGACRCPVDPPPHERDSALIREQLGAGAKIAVHDAGFLAGSGVFFSEGAAKMRLVLEGVVEWTFVMPDGQPRPLNPVQVNLLDQPTLDRLADELDGSLKHEPLPKASAGRSRGTSPGRRSPTPMTPRPLKRTGT